MPRFSSFESVRSSQSSVSKVRTTEYERQRRYNFLGRHPPPVQRRSTSLPRILENQPPAQSSPRQALFFGGSTNRPRPGYIKIPRFVPLEIRLNPSAEVKTNSSSALCEHDYEGRGIVHCNHCGQRFSMDSSRSTRGGSEVPSFKTDLLNENGAPSGSKVVIQVVENKIKAVFGKAKENAAQESEDPAS